MRAGPAPRAEAHHTVALSVAPPRRRAAVAGRRGTPRRVCRFDVILTALLALTTAGCGSDGSTPADPPPAADAVSADTPRPTAEELRGQPHYQLTVTVSSGETWELVRALGDRPHALFWDGRLLTLHDTYYAPYRGFLIDLTPLQSGPDRLSAPGPTFGVAEQYAPSIQVMVPSADVIEPFASWAAGATGSFEFTRFEPWTGGRVEGTLQGTLVHQQQGNPLTAQVSGRFELVVPEETDPHANSTP